MNNFNAGLRIFLLGVCCLLLQTDSFSQINIPYGDDGIMIREKGEDPSKFVLDGRDWDCRYLTYFFVNGTGDISGNNEEAAVRNAMASWSAVTNIDFIEVCSAAAADIRISWEDGDHGDGFPFDGSFGVLAHAFFPPPNGGALAGDVHFDDDETWQLDGSNFDMETVALHELGHSLGLRHSDQPGSANAVMEAVYEGERRILKTDDINGIQAIYGTRENPISGLGTICYTGEYVLDDFACLGGKFTVTWNASDNLEIEAGQGTGAVMVKPLETTGFGLLGVTISSGCGQISFKVKINLIDCEGCCPPGASYDGANCHFGIDFPEGYEGFVWDDKFYTKPNCNISTANNCCPPGSTFDGANCYFGVGFPSWFDGFVWNNSFYTQTNCIAKCCPGGFNYDSRNCYSGFTAEGVEAFIYDNNFYTTTNCKEYPDNNCCPPGTSYDGANCYYGPVPFGYHGFVWNNTFYTETNCEICCPPGANYDGANCFYGVNYPEGYEGFIWDDKFYVKPNCKISTANNCCPPGSSFDGANCYFGIEIPEGYSGFIWNNGFYTRPVDCYKTEKDGKGFVGEGLPEAMGLPEAVLPKWGSKESNLTAFPNPTNGSFTVDLSSVYDQVTQVDLISVEGKEILSLEKNDLEQVLKIDEDLESGVYFIHVTLGEAVETIRVVKMQVEVDYF